MFGSFKIHAGDFGEKKDAQFVAKTFLMPKPGAFWGQEKYDISQVEVLEQASEENVKRLGGTVGWGVAGAALLGPVGLLAGLLVGGRGKDVTFIVQFMDGKKALCTASSKVYTQILAARF
ncbi:hypothetical protein HOP51_08640 [Halomonas sp. MCCC 1A11036]|uniref:Uncharacterized protein n=1 Tax=Billgrantia zhangzhouensis TaxID=2733481 RepID=A0ABS9AEN8_9GAMM|nr:hypothetical protein [Halomonas zhangzhouensis]MCE8020181.1 hypothetical protein [Halomonas zhangzhouensis]NIC38734.1 hypothetical protein [Halomonas desiderata]